MKQHKFPDQSTRHRQSWCFQQEILLPKGADSPAQLLCLAVGRLLSHISYPVFRSKTLGTEKTPPHVPVLDTGTAELWDSPPEPTGTPPCCTSTGSLQEQLQPFPASGISLCQASLASWEHVRIISPRFLLQGLIMVQIQETGACAWEEAGAEDNIPFNIHCKSKRWKFR